MEFRERFKGRSLPKNQIGSPVRAHSARSCVNVRRSTRHGHVFSAGAPNSRRPFPSLSLSLSFSHRFFVYPVVVPSAHPRASPIPEDPFRTRSATHKGSGLSYARYYTLYTISFHLDLLLPPHPSKPYARLIAPAGEEIRALPYASVLYTLRPRHCGARPMGNDDSEREREREREREGNRRAGPRRKPRDFLV
jgi:hypothetical protein